MRLCSGKMWKSNVKNIFSHNFPSWPVGVKSYRVVLTAQSLKTRQQNGPKLEILQTAIRYMFGYQVIDISSLWHIIWKKKKKKKSVVTKTTRHLPENDNSYLDSMTGTNSSNDRLILRRNVEINSNWYFSYDVFSGMKSSATWNGNAIAQSPRKMSELRDISNTSDIRFLMVYRTISDVILHLFIICNDLWCQLPFFHKLSVITEALFSVRCLRYVVVTRM